MYKLSLNFVIENKTIALYYRDPLTLRFVLISHVPWSASPPLCIEISNNGVLESMILFSYHFPQRDILSKTYIQRSKTETVKEKVGIGKMVN